MPGKSRIYDENRVHRSWSPLFSPDIVRRLKSIEEHMGGDYATAPENVLRFAGTDLDAIKIVILGPDPFAQNAQIADASSWSERNLNTFLRNIARNLYRTHSGKNQKFGTVRSSIEKKTFSILPPNELFGAWEKQGVLLLNAGHNDIWRPFAWSLVRFITAKRPDVVWFLWGKEARDLWSRAILKFAAGRDSYVAHAYPHPASPGGAKGESFTDSDCFEIGARLFGIDWTGVEKTG